MPSTEWNARALRCQLMKDKVNMMVGSGLVGRKASSMDSLTNMVTEIRKRKKRPYTMISQR